MLFQTPGPVHPEVPLLLTIPHSGEEIPQEAYWLTSHPSELLLRDVDRFVDVLYSEAIRDIGLPSVQTLVHRYAADLNRYPEDIDAAAVEGSPHPAGKFTQGFHWVKSTIGEMIIEHPIPLAVHDLIVKRYHDRFHELIASRIAEIQALHGKSPVYHFDLHSMPSRGTGAHADQGRSRAEVVLSDFEGRSCAPEFMNLTRRVFESVGFEVAINWPYKGGRMTQRYGRPEAGHHTVQIELNRKLYMNEATRDRIPGQFEQVQVRLKQALALIVAELKSIKIQ